jgi:hypothetical protein
MIVSREEYKEAVEREDDGGAIALPPEAEHPPEGVETEVLPDEAYEDHVRPEYDVYDHPAAAAAAAAADAVLFDDGPQEPQEGASESLDVSVEAGVAKKPRRARKPAPGGDADKPIPDDPATPDVSEPDEPAEA